MGFLIGAWEKDKWEMRYFKRAISPESFSRARLITSYSCIGGVSDLVNITPSRYSSSGFTRPNETGAEVHTLWWVGGTDGNSGEGLIAIVSWLVFCYFDTS